MANENPSRENPSRQQSAERSQTGASQQGTGAQQGTGHGSYGTGSYAQGGTSQGTQNQGSYGSQGRYANQERQGQGRGSVGTSTWQGGRQSGGPLATGGGASTSPYFGSSGYGSGPFSIMRRISDEMDRLFENFGMGRSLFQNEPSGGGQWDAGSYGAGAPSMWSPHIEVSERNGKLVIQADLPGMKRDDIHVRVEDDEIIIQGERRQDQTTSQAGYYRSERSYGSFYRAIPLPEGTNAESANATFRDGVLEIELDAPRQQQRGRTLEVRDAGPAHAGTTSGTTYGSGTSGTSGGQSLQSGTGGGQQSSSTGSTQHSAAGTSGTQHAAGSGTMYSGSGNPSVGASGMGGSQTGSASDQPPRGSNT